MTSVPQLPVEAVPAKVSPAGETPRVRAQQPSEEGAEGGFAAVLAHALPEFVRAVKAAVAVAPTSLEVEGEDVSEETAVVADAGETDRPASAVKTAAPPVALETPPQDLAAETGTEQGPQLVATTQTPQGQSVAHAGEALEESAEVPRQPAPTQPSEVFPPLRELTDAPTKPQEDRPTDERTQESRPAPEPVELETVAAAATLASPAAATQPEQAPPTKPAAPGKQDAPPALRAEGAAEAKPWVERPSAAKRAPRPASEAPVIEFQVRRDRLPQDARPKLEKPGLVRATPNTAPESQPTNVPQLKQAPPTAEAALRATAPTVDKGSEAVATTPVVPTRSRSAVTQPVVPTPDDAQAGRSDSDGAKNARREPAPEPTTLVKSIPANLVVEPEAVTEPPQPGLLKPVIVAQTPSAPTAALPQLTAQTNMPAESSSVHPPKDTASTASAKPPRAPEIAANLQQQSGRTTLNVVLQDERLGRVALQLVERGGWIETAIRASDPRTAQTLSNGAAGLFDALQQRGLALATGGGASSAWDAQEGQRRDSPRRDQESQGRRFRLRRNANEFEGALARAEV